MKNLKQSQNSFQRLKRIIIDLKGRVKNKNVELGSKGLVYKKKFEKLLAKDMDMPGVLSNFWSLLKDNKLSNDEKFKLVIIHDSVIGIGMINFENEKVEINNELQELLKIRNNARDEKNWKIADKMRDKILKLGFEIIDSIDGSELKRKKD